MPSFGYMMSPGCCSGSGGSTALPCGSCAGPAGDLTLTWRYFTFDGTGAAAPSYCPDKTIKTAISTTLHYYLGPSPSPPLWRSDFTLAPTDSTLSGIYLTGCRYIRFVLKCEATFNLYLEVSGSYYDATHGDGCPSDTPPELRILTATGATCSPFYRPFLGYRAAITFPNSFPAQCNTLFCDGVVSL